MGVLRRLILTASALGLGLLGSTPSALAIPSVVGTQDPTSSFVATGRAGTLVLSSAWSDLRRVEVWAFRDSAYTGSAQHGSMLLRWDAGAGGVSVPELPIPSLGDGSYHLTVIGYLQTSAIRSEEIMAPYNVTCPVKNKNLRNATSNDTDYCAFDMVVFDNLQGSLRCASGNCITSTSMPGAIVPESGWWWNPAEPGRWLLVEENDGWIFLSFLVFDADGQPTWYLAPGAVSTDGVFSAPLTQYVGGQTLTGSHKLPAVVGAGGTLGIKFSGGGTGVMTLPDGRQVPIERFRF